MFGFNCSSYFTSYEFRKLSFPSFYLLGRNLLYYFLSAKQKFIVCCSVIDLFIEDLMRKEFYSENYHRIL